MKYVIITLLALIPLWAWAQPAPTSKVITVGWAHAAVVGPVTFTTYAQPECSGAISAVGTVAWPALTMAFSSSLLVNTCIYVTAQTTDQAATESTPSNIIRWPQPFAGGFPVRLAWDVPLTGAAVAQYRVKTQAGCTGDYATVATVSAATLSYLILPPLTSTDCWTVTALDAGGSEGTPSDPFQIPANIINFETPPFIFKVH